jgi:anti-anti-sigma regulatory factor
MKSIVAGGNMNIIIEQLATDKPVAIMKIQGELDGSTYLSLIQQAQQLYAAGTRQLLLDLSEMTFLSSAGLVGLHTVVMVMRGQQPPDMEDGWGVMHGISREITATSRFDANCKLLRPQPRVQKTLDITGFSGILEVFTDRDTAVSSFN